MPYAVDITGQVALFGQPNDHYCGPASARMVRNGYPNPPGGQVFDQDDLWNRIQANNSKKTVDQAQKWYTDPLGMRETLFGLDKPPVAGWTIVSGSRANVLLAALVSLKAHRYPIPMLVNQGDHWIVLTGFVTDVEPVDGGKPKLNRVCLRNPWPIGTGATESLTASEFASTRYFGQSVGKPGTWRYKSVCVAERPVQGNVRIAAERFSGRSKAAAAATLRPRALAAFTEGDFIPCDSVATFATLGRSAGPAVSVQPATPAGGVAAIGGYHLVPVAPRGMAASALTDGGAVAGVLMVAETGMLQGAVAFGQPVQFISRRQAIDVVAKAMAAPVSARGAQATLMFRPSTVSMSKAWPFWRVQIAGRTLFVDQNGLIHPRLEPPRPGA